MGVSIYIQVPEHNGEQSKAKRSELQDTEGAGGGTSEGHELRRTEVFVLRQSAKSHRTRTRIQVTCVPLTQLCTVDERFCILTHIILNTFPTVGLPIPNIKH